ncbi:MAG TPA: hypothetical protein VHN99_08960 [Deinococcales bacterium]|nr:hypothetical protein [Deinococcales bacterium]
MELEATPAAWPLLATGWLVKVGSPLGPLALLSARARALLGVPGRPPSGEAAARRACWRRARLALESGGLTFRGLRRRALLEFSTPGGTLVALASWRPVPARSVRRHLAALAPGECLAVLCPGCGRLRRLADRETPRLLLGSLTPAKAFRPHRIR